MAPSLIQTPLGIRQVSRGGPIPPPSFLPENSPAAARWRLRESARHFITKFQVIELSDGSPLCEYFYASSCKAYRDALLRSLEEGMDRSVALLFAGERADLEESSSVKSYSEAPDSTFF